METWLAELIEKYDNEKFEEKPKELEEEEP